MLSDRQLMEAFYGALEFSSLLMGREEAAEVPRLHVLRELLARETRRTIALQELRKRRSSWGSR